MHSNIILTGLEEAIIIKVEVRKEQYIIHFEMPVVKQICPSCQAETIRIHDYRMTKIKHLKFGERMTTLFYRKRRYVCACKKRFAEKNPIIDRYQRCSKEWNQMAQARAEKGKTFKDVRLTKPAIITLTGKGNKQRSVPIMEKTRDLLESYMKENNLLENGRQDHSLFYNNNRGPFTRPGIAYILEKYFNQAKETHPEALFPDRLHPHMFRHTKAMHLLEAGVNLIYIRDFLGHVQITTTEIYLRANTETKRKALEAAYMEVVTQDIPVWSENTNLLKWLQNFCR